MATMLTKLHVAKMAFKNQYEIVYVQAIKSEIIRVGVQNKETKQLTLFGADSSVSFEKAEAEKLFKVLPFLFSYND